MKVRCDCSGSCGLCKALILGGLNQNMDCYLEGAVPGNIVFCSEMMMFSRFTSGNVTSRVCLGSLTALFKTADKSKQIITHR